MNNTLNRNRYHLAPFARESYYNKYIGYVIGQITCSTGFANRYIPHFHIATLFPAVQSNTDMVSGISRCFISAHVVRTKVNNHKLSGNIIKAS